MIAKFIGKDWSMGLRHGKLYDISIESKEGSDMIIVRMGNWFCPYSSFRTLTKNWDISLSENKK